MTERTDDETARFDREREAERERAREEGAVAARRAEDRP